SRWASVTRLCLLRTKMKGCDFSMGIYTEKRDQLIEKIKGLEKRIASDTAKKKTLEDKLKEVSRLAMAEEYNCKPRELDEIITLEHSLLQKLRASGLSDDELLKLVGGGNTDTEKSDTVDLTADFGQQMSFTDKANPYED
ncbi:hypothetical protein, partial [Ruminococcus albus]